MSKPEGGGPPPGMSSAMLAGSGAMGDNSTSGVRSSMNVGGPEFGANLNQTFPIGGTLSTGFEGDSFENSTNITAINTDAAMNAKIENAFDGGVMSQGNVNAFAGMDSFNAAGNMTLTSVSAGNTFSAPAAAGIPTGPAKGQSQG